jgi:hypothetical protein
MALLKESMRLVCRQFRKLIVIALLLFSAICLSSPVGFAATVDIIGFGDGDWGSGNSPGILSERSDWNEVAEMEYVASDSRITASNYSIYDPSPTDAGWGGVMWIWGTPGYVETVFDNPSNSLFVQFESDSNDGPADFYIDGVYETSLNSNYGSWFAVVFSGLSWQSHTLRVVATSSGYPRDLAIDCMGSGAPVPIPGAVWLLGSGLVSLVGLRKKFKK